MNIILLNQTIDSTSSPSSSKNEMGEWLIRLGKFNEIHETIIDSLNEVEAKIKEIAYKNFFDNLLKSVNVEKSREIYNKLIRFEKLEDNWDSYGSPAPTSLSINETRDILRNLFSKKLFPSNIYPVADDGIIIEFKKKDKNYIWIHIYNDGEIVYLNYTDGKSKTCTIAKGDIEKYLSEIYLKMNE
ncbi:hypothetical protein [Leptospira kirschneri]|uniref:hypothetical protein n=1 Tax=Leptospira kirschneri TaxID=29507 RepID=UPI003564B2CB